VYIKSIIRFLKILISNFDILFLKLKYHQISLFFVLINELGIFFIKEKLEVIRILDEKLKANNSLELIRTFRYMKKKYLETSCRGDESIILNQRFFAFI